MWNELLWQVAMFLNRVCLTINGHYMSMAEESLQEARVWYTLGELDECDRLSNVAEVEITKAREWAERSKMWLYRARSLTESL